MNQITIKTLERMSPEQLLAFAKLNTPILCELNANGSITLIQRDKSKDKSLINHFISALKRWQFESDAGFLPDENTGFVLRNGTIRHPIQTWVRAFKKENYIEHLLEIAPDFVFECVTEDDSMELIHQRAQNYISNGVQLVWFLDETAQIVTVFSQNKEKQVFNLKEKISGESVLPKFEFIFKSKT